jgi:hypothetical protein
MKRVALVLTAVFALAASSPVLAADFCIHSTPVGLLVGKGFLVPPKNKCKPFNGFGNGGMAVGTGCTTADGSIFRLQFVIHRATENFTESGSCNFRLPLSCSDIDRCNCWGTAIFPDLSSVTLHQIFDYAAAPAAAGHCLVGEANVP